MVNLEQIGQIIKEFLVHPGENLIAPDSNEPSWGEPLVGVSRGDDPLYAEIKHDIGPFYWTPDDAFKNAYPETGFTSGSLAVIVWILPQTKATKQEQRRQTVHPGKRWNLTRFYGEETNNRLRDHMADFFTANGYPATAPVRQTSFALVESPEWGIASTWSERHAAYVSGLGTFGLSDGLITTLGQAVRIGSVVAKIDLPPTPRTYNDRHGYCLFYSKGGCGACMRRCPAGAITEQGHDKDRCFAYIKNISSDFSKEELGAPADSCGLCQTGVPCESCIPDRKLH